MKFLCQGKSYGLNRQTDGHTNRQTQRQYETCSDGAQSVALSDLKLYYRFTLAIINNLYHKFSKVANDLSILKLKLFIP